MTFGHDVFGFNGYGVTNRIFNAAGTTDDFTGDKVKIWQHCMEDADFSTGWKLELGEGEYDRETLDPDGKNDNISAIWIPDGYTVVAHQNYIGDAETGTTWTWVGPMMKTCLVDDGANDEISYLKITYEEPDADPNDCASENRAVNTDKTCGACLTGHSLVGNECVADEDENGILGLSPVVIIGGILGVLLIKALGQKCLRTRFEQ